MQNYAQVYNRIYSPETKSQIQLDKLERPFWEYPPQ